MKHQIIPVSQAFKILTVTLLAGVLAAPSALAGRGGMRSTNRNSNRNVNVNRNRNVNVNANVNHNRSRS
jgi:hypothetical protein